MKRIPVKMVPMVLLVLLSSCSGDLIADEELRSSLTFYASFDRGFQADFALGDPALYVAPSWNRRSELERYDGSGELHIQEGAGRYGAALSIDARNEPVFIYRGEMNMPYAEERWSGTLSFWLRLDPDLDLAPGYSDPIQVTSRGWNDAALFVDFTDEPPRIFRFAIFPDRDVWDPQRRDWSDVPTEERPMVDVTHLPFGRDEWTHVALAFRNFNTGSEDGTVTCYINGEKIGVLDSREQTFTWEPEEVAIWIGYHYRGFFDELAIFNRELSGQEVDRIYSLENGIRDLPGLR